MNARSYRRIVPILMVLVFCLVGLSAGSVLAKTQLPAATPVASVRPFDPRTDKLATDSTPQLNRAGSDSNLPDLYEQRRAAGFGGLPWPAR